MLWIKMTEITDWHELSAIPDKETLWTMQYTRHVEQEHCNNSAHQIEHNTLYKKRRSMEDDCIFKQREQCQTEKLCTMHIPYNAYNVMGWVCIVLHKTLTL